MDDELKKRLERAVEALQLQSDPNAQLAAILLRRLASGEWQMVPVGPTDEMVIRGAEAAHDAGVHSDDSDFDQELAESVHAAMLAAAPNPLEK